MKNINTGTAIPSCISITMLGGGGGGGGGG